MLKVTLATLALGCLVTATAATGVRGRVVDAEGRPVPGVTVSLTQGGQQAVTDASGTYWIENATPGADRVVATAPGYNLQTEGVQVEPVGVSQVDDVVIVANDKGRAVEEINELFFDISDLESDDDSSQSIARLAGASDDIYYNTASYNFGPMYFRFRGYDSQYQSIYLNGIKMNDPIRGRFSFGTLMGMTSRAFRQKTATVGIAASDYAFGSIGGSTNYNTLASGYAPGFYGSVAYTNSNYSGRVMATYATGLNAKGWAFVVSAIGRYSHEGVQKGTWYNSGGLFMSLDKKIDDNNTINLTAFGGPTERAVSTPTYQEAYDLVGSNMYNPCWGWYQGKKRSASIVQSADPTAILTWLYKDSKTTVNTSASINWNLYNKSALNWYKANDPNPAYYRNLPSYYADNQEQYDFYENLWRTDDNFRQINWDRIYRVNALNNVANQGLPESERQGSSYILEKRVSNLFNARFNTYVNRTLTSRLSLQAGAHFAYTHGSYYKTIKDLLGGDYWLDIDPFSDRDITLNPTMLQNNLDDPNRHVGKGDKFGYDYSLNELTAGVWLQNTLTLPHWDLNYGLDLTYTQFQRDGRWRNGRAPDNSKGKSRMQRFDNAMVKIGATYKIDGRNFIIGHAQYGTRAPLADAVFIAPRVKNDVIDDPQSERIFAGDIAYAWSYRRFRGALTGFYTSTANGTERSAFFDDRYSAYTNYVLQDVKKVYGGVELGMAYDITSSLTATVAATYARYQYKNNPLSTRSFENGMYPDTTQTVYLRNYYAGSTPQTVVNVGLDWAAPNNWYFNINGTWMADAYVNFSPVYHEALPDLWQQCGSEQELQAKIEELARQDKLNNQFCLNASIGKAIYFGRYSLNINVNVTNILNNQNIAVNAFQQSRLDTKNYDRNKYPNRLTYSQGIKVFANIGFRF